VETTASLAELTTLLGRHDRTTLGHSWRVSRLVRATATHLGVTAAERRAVALAGLVHDVGKIAIPAAILAKPVELSGDEEEAMRTHASIGSDLVSPFVAAEVAHAVAHHHDRVDEARLPWMTLLVSVADTYDALVSTRPYRVGCSPAGAFEELRRVAGSQLDAEMVEALIGVETGPPRHSSAACRSLARVA